jgi:hypothetical protein
MADEAMSDLTSNLSTILATLEELQAENATLRETLFKFQSAIPSVTPSIEGHPPNNTLVPNPPPPYQESYPEPKVSLPDTLTTTWFHQSDPSYPSSTTPLLHYRLPPGRSPRFSTDRTSRSMVRSFGGNCLATFGRFLSLPHGV